MELRFAVIPAAGRGTRLLPITKVVCKELIPIIDKPTAEYAVQEISQSGFEEVIFITPDKKGNIKKYFLPDEKLNSYLKKQGQDMLLKNLPYYQNLSFKSVQQKKPSGLGAAVLCAEKIVKNAPFVVTLVDDIIDATPPVLKQLKDVFKKVRSSVIAIMEVPQKDVSKYGIVEGREVSPGLFKLTRLVEKPQPHETNSNLAIVGRYLLTPQIFKCLKNTAPGKGKEVQLTDALNLLLQKESIYAYKFKGTRIDAGDKLGLLKANLYFGAKKEKKWRQELQNFLQSIT